MSKSLIITTLFALLLVSFSLFLYWRHNNSFKKEESPINIEQINKIIIKEKEKSEIILEKKGEQWLLASQNDTLADEVKINQLLEALRPIDKLSLVSENPEKFPQFGIDNNAPRLTINFKETEKKITIGNLSYTRNGNFIKFDQEDKIWLISSYLRTRLENIDWEAEITPTPTQE